MCVSITRTESPSMCLAYTWRVPPMYPGGSGRQLRLPGGKVQPGRSSNQVSVRRPRLADSHPPARGPGHLPRHPQMPAAAVRPGPAVSDLDPDHAVCSPDRDHAPLPAAPEPLCRTLFPDSSLTSSVASSPHRCHGPSTPTVNARATRARSGPRPSSRSPGPPWPSAHPPFPANPGGNHRAAGRTHRCTPSSAARVKP